MVDDRESLKVLWQSHSVEYCAVHSKYGHNAFAIIGRIFAIY